MAKELGQAIRLSLPRRVVCDLVEAGMGFPLVMIQKTINVAELVAVRRLAQPRPSWCGIFTKAYAKVVASQPDLRRVFLGFPWARLFEYNEVSGDIVVNALVHGEYVPVMLPVHGPEALSLAELDARILDFTKNCAPRLRRYRRALWLARFPRVVRHWVWWWALNSSGRLRAKFFSTFTISSVGNWGVDSLRPLAPCTTLLHYGAIDPQGSLTIRLTFDHRILDGMGASLAVNELERVLMTDLLAEVRLLSPGLLKAS